MKIPSRAYPNVINYTVSSLGKKYYASLFKYYRNYYVRLSRNTWTTWMAHLLLIEKDSISTSNNEEKKQKRVWKADCVCIAYGEITEECGENGMNNCEHCFKFCHFSFAVRLLFVRLSVSIALQAELNIIKK